MTRYVVTRLIGLIAHESYHVAQERVRRDAPSPARTAADTVLVGALGVSGDSSCADHAIAWRTRNALKLDFVPGGVGPNNSDQISFSGPWSQAHCVTAKDEDAVVAALPPVAKAPAAK